MAGESKMSSEKSVMINWKEDILFWSGDFIEKMASLLEWGGHNGFWHFWKYV